uniref:Uncharacterized protein n=1 Tax=Aquila chrysaetos chrysaetos TaxID=223781 RepID=A0A663EN95_AQUCH
MGKGTSNCSEKEHGMTWVNLSKHPPPPNQKSCSVSSAYEKNHSGNTACKHHSGIFPFLFFLVKK